METHVAIRLVDDVKIVVPRDITLITPFVLLEQEDWFESELEFTRRALEPGMVVVDVGANYGVFTLAAAKVVGAKGRVIAYEPTPAVAESLTRSVQINGFAQARIERCALSDRQGEAFLSVSEHSELNHLSTATAEGNGDAVAVRLETLDAQCASLGLGLPDFVKIDAEGHGMEVLRGGSRTFDQGDPLVLFEVKDGEGTFDLDMVAAFEKLGYRAYNLLPGAQFLIPFDAGAPVDAYTLNVFVAKPSRVERLARRGLLADPAFLESGPPASWRDYLAAAPYAAARQSAWSRGPRIWARSEDKVYHEALEGFARSRVAAGRSAWARYAALSGARRQALEALGAKVSLARLLTAARLEYELGARAAAVGLLGPVAAALMAGEVALPDEPFLAPIQRYEEVAWDGEDKNWVISAVLESFVRLSHYSNYYSRGGTDQYLEWLSGSRYASDEMRRGLCLSRLIRGLPVGEDAMALAVPSERNRNADLWAGLLATKAS